MRIKQLVSTKFLAMVLAATCLLSTSVQAQTIADLIKKGKVTIGVISGTPPFGSANAQGEPIGYDIDVANLIGRYLGLPVELVPLTPPARIPTLEAGKVDFLVATLAPTPERAKSVLFSMPYSGFELSIVGPVGTKYASLHDLVKKRVGVSRGSTNDTALSRSAPTGTNIIRYEDDATTVQALLTNQVDVISIPSTMALDVIKTRAQGKIELKFPYSVQPNSMTVRKGGYEMLQWLNTFISYVRVNGELDAISRKWSGAPLPNLPVF